MISTNSDGTCDVRYQDGDEERRVSPENIRDALLLDGAGAKPTGREGGKPKYRVGTKVEARFKGRGRWFPGVVIGVSMGGTSYDIRYDDGDEELGVGDDCVRLASESEPGSPGSPKASDPRGQRISAFSAGDEVEANYKGKGKWFKGRVRLVHRDGLMDIRYNDGDSEQGVEAKNVRSISSSIGGGAPEAFNVGDDVEANFKGKGKWFKGKVRFVHRDGSFDIRYDDGDTEDSVKAANIRRRETPSSSGPKSAQSDLDSLAPEPAEYNVGQEVEARFGGRSRWLAGTIMRKNRDGTYHVRYSDGKDERYVEKDMIRSVAKKRHPKSPGRRVISGVDDSEAEELSPSYRAGDEVEANFKGKGKWFKGSIRLVNRDGTYDIRYDDGDIERGVEPKNIRSVGAKTSSPKSTASAADEFTAGDEVEANFKGKGKWFKGTIRLANSDGTFDIRYDDGDREDGVKAACVRKRGGAPSSPAQRRKPSALAMAGDDNISDLDSVAPDPTEYSVGQEVEARFEGRSRWLPGTVMRKNRDGTYHIRYANGEDERYVEKDMICAAKNLGRPKSPGRRVISGAEDSEPEPESYRQGDKVEANFKGKGRWFKGKIDKINRDGTYDIRYDDGDSEMGVAVKCIRRIGGNERTTSATKSAAAESFAVGDEVEANFKGKGKWFKGKIRFARRDGTFDIRYNDGDTEDGVAATNIRMLVSSSSSRRRGPGPADDGVSDLESVSPVATEFDVGQEVEARFGGRSRWLAGTIMRKNRDGTFHVRYSNGDNERYVEKDMIRSVDKKDRPSSPGRRVISGAADSESDVASSEAAYRAGDEVEANFKGKGRWFKGKIRLVNRDGTFDIRYDDGDTEQGVGAKSIRALAGAGKPVKAAAAESSYSVGDEVEVNFKGKGRWFKGKIHFVHRDGTFDVRYDDGDTEQGVETRNLRPIDGPSKHSDLSAKASSAESSFAVGDGVEANYKGKGRWFKGKIRFVHRDGTFDVRYDDGDTEQGLEARNLRPLAGQRKSVAPEDDLPAKGGPLESSFAAGDEIEGNYKGKGKWFKGKVRFAHRDGTFDIRYNDGDTEQGIEARNLRRVDGPEASSSKSSSSDAFKAGDEVEGNYKGKGKWFKGKVRFAHRDGTYDIRYNDGDTEQGVFAKNVRSLPTTDASSAKSSSATAFNVGNKVEANYKGKGKWFKAKIRFAHRNGTFDVRYDDGDSEQGVEAENLRSLLSPGNLPDSTSPAETFRVGDEVEGNYKGKGKWFKGRIQYAHRDGTFDLRFNDGDTEQGVEAANIRSLSAPSSKRSDRPSAKSSVVSFATDDVVEANFKGKGRWFKGKVLFVHSDGTYDIRYDDGDKERAVRPENIRLLDSGNATGDIDASVSRKFDVGDSVESNFKGKGKWFKGIIKRVNRADSTYDIRYDDGDSERGVSEDLIRPLASTTKTADSAGPSDVETVSASFSVGDKVEGNYRRKGKWFPGKIRYAHRNGTFDVRYDDGDTEQNLEVQYLRPAPRRLQSSAESKEPDIDAKAFKVGDSVEANFKGRGKWLAGDIIGSHTDGTFDIRYADGDRELRVGTGSIRFGDSSAKGSSPSTALDPKSDGNPSSRIRGARAQSESDGTADQFEVGDSIEANFKGKGKWFKARIGLVHRDGTFDINYEDGDREKRVDSSRVRSIISKAAQKGFESESDDGGELIPGAAILARYRGNKDWLPGHISAARSDGSFDVRYASGESERRVPRRFIKLSDGKLGEALAASDDSGPSQLTDTELPDNVIAVCKRVYDAISAKRKGKRVEDELLRSFDPYTHRGREVRISADDFKSALGKMKVSLTTSELKSLRREFADSRKRLHVEDFCAEVLRTGSRAKRTKLSPRAIKREQRTPGDAASPSSSVSGFSSAGGKSDSSPRHRRTSGSSDGEDADVVELLPSELSKALRQLSRSGAERRSQGGQVSKAAAAIGIDCNSTFKKSQLSHFLRELHVKSTKREQEALWECLGASGGSSGVSVNAFIELTLWEPGGAVKDLAGLHRRLARDVSRSLNLESSRGVTKKALQKVLDALGGRTLRWSDVRSRLEDLGSQVSDKSLAILKDRFDEAGTGNVESRVLALWLCSGLDVAIVESHTRNLLNLIARKGGSPTSVFRISQPKRKSGRHVEDRFTITREAFFEALAQMGLPLTHGQQIALAERYAADKGDAKQVNCEKFLQLASQGPGSPARGLRGWWSNRSARPQQQEAGSDSATSSAVEGSSNASKTASEGSAPDDRALLCKVERQLLAALGATDCTEEGSMRAAASGILARSSGGRLPGKKSAAPHCGKAVLTRKQAKKLLLRHIRLLPPQYHVASEESMLDTVLECLLAAVGNAKPDEACISLRDLMELTLCESESGNLTKIHGRMSQDLRKKAEKGAFGRIGSLSALDVALKPFKSLDSSGIGSLSTPHFLKALEKLGCGGPTRKDLDAIITRFDPSDEGSVNYERFAVWLASGLDTVRLSVKVGAFYELLKQKGVSIRSTLNEVEEDGTGEGLSTKGVIHCLRKVLGLPLTQGEVQGLVRECSAGNGLGVLRHKLLYFSADGNRGKDGKKMTNREKPIPAADSDTDGGGSDVDDGAAPLRQRSRAAQEDLSSQSEDDVTKSSPPPSRAAQRGARSAGKKKSVRGELRQMAVLIREQVRHLADTGVDINWEETLNRTQGGSGGTLRVSDLNEALKVADIALSQAQTQILAKHFTTDEEEGISIRPLVKWLEACTGLDLRMLRSIQRHIKGRLGRAFDLRALYNEMTRGKKHLSSKRLARGLRSAGLHANDETIEILVGAFDADGDGRLDYTEFHEMVYAEELSLGNGRIQGGSLSPISGRRASSTWHSTAKSSPFFNETISSAALGGTSSQVIVDGEVYRSVVRGLEKAFSFFDDDNSNSVSVREMENILRALGQDPSRKEIKALMRRADKDRNGSLQFEEFQEAVMPYVMDRVTSRKPTDADLRATFDAIDVDNSGSISREEFIMAFVGRLKVLTPPEAESILSVADSNGDGSISWEEFAQMFQLLDAQDSPAHTLLRPEFREGLQVALLKLSMGAQPNPEEYLTAFMGMPSNFRKSILSHFDGHRDYQLSTLIAPVLDSRGGVVMPDAVVKVITTVAETTIHLNNTGGKTADIVSVSKSPERGQSPGLSKRIFSFGKSSSAGASATISDASTPTTPSHSGGPGSSTVMRRSSVRGGGEHLKETNILKSAELQPVDDVSSPDVLQVVLSVKRGLGIPVPYDSRAGDVLQRSLRVCLIYMPPKEVDGDLGSGTVEPEDCLYGNTYKTLAKQDPNKEEVWLFPSGDDGDRKILVRTDFDDPVEPKAREHIYVLMELTCTIRTDLSANDADNDR